MKKHIPNIITCGNLICGCIATGAAFLNPIPTNYFWAIVLILLGALLDFFDGMVARALGVSSPIGKELDSLADVVTFGVAPSAMLFSLFREVQYPQFMESLRTIMPYTAYVMAAFAAFRLAKFNLLTLQSTSILGLPTPANALFWGSLIVGQHAFLVSGKFNAMFLFLFMLLFCFLLVAELPLFALKFKNLSWADNKIKYVFLLGCIPCFWLAETCFAGIIMWYVFLSLIAPYVSQAHDHD